MINVGCLFTSRTRCFFAVRGYHMYKDIWEPSVGEKLIALRDFSNLFHKFAVKVLNAEEIVGHLPRKYSRIAGDFLAHGG